MDLFDSPDESEFRSRLRAWLAERLTDDWRAHYQSLDERELIEFMREWQRQLRGAGFVARSWPMVYGGQESTLIEDLILFEEFSKADAPKDVFRIGIRIIGPMLIKLGREDQKAFFLPRIVDGTDLWSQGFSEPGAGSDLASLQTFAERNGDVYRINGQKVWNTYGHLADYCLLLVRTDRDVAKHKGLTAFIVKMDTAGIDVRPLDQMNGRPDFNEIFFNDVEVPVDAMVGEAGDGWKVACTMLDFERRGIAVLGFECHRLFCRLLNLAKEVRLQGDDCCAIENPVIRRRLAEFGTQARIAVLNNYRFAAKVPKGGIPGPETSIQKLHATELNKSIHAFALELIGSADMTDPYARKLYGYWSEEYLTSFGMTIAGGTSQIQRNIIGTRALELPR